MDKIPIFGLHLNTFDFFNNLAFVFGIKANNDNLLKIPVKTGTGIIRKVEVAPGIDLIFFDFYLKHKIALKKVMAVPAEVKMFAAICILTPDSFVAIKNDQVNQTTGQNIPTILFTSAANELDFMIFPDHSVKAVIIHFTLDSLQRECTDEDIAVHENFKESIRHKRHLHFKEPAPVSFYQKLAELHDHALRNRMNKFVVKSQAISLLLDILNQVLTKNQYEEENNKLVYAKMEAVKEMLGEYLEAKLPAIPVIARKIAVSESTLKRNFKQVFGTSLYEYYLQIKMERARELFAEKPLSVKEVAYKLGYEKTSSFIKIFKKFYNFSPGELKKKIMTY